MDVVKEKLNYTSSFVPAQLTTNKIRLRHIDTLTKSNIKIDKVDLPTVYCLPELHTNPYKSRFISNSSHCPTTVLSMHITSALTAVKDHVIKYSATAFSNNSNVNYFWSIKNSSEVMEKFRLQKLQGSQVSSFDFSTLYTSFPHDLIKAKVSFVKWCVNRESLTYLCTSDKVGFFSNKKKDSYTCWICTELCEAFTFLMENIYMCNLMA